MGRWCRPLPMQEPMCPNSHQPHSEYHSGPSISQVGRLALAIDIPPTWKLYYSGVSTTTTGHFQSVYDSPARSLLLLQNVVVSVFVILNHLVIPRGEEPEFPPLELSGYPTSLQSTTKCAPCRTR